VKIPGAVAGEIIIILENKNYKTLGVARRAETSDSTRKHIMN
jgi:hypothetical protein